MTNRINHLLNLNYFLSRNNKENKAPHKPVLLSIHASSGRPDGLPPVARFLFDTVGGEEHNSIRSVSWRLFGAAADRYRFSVRG